MIKLVGSLLIICASLYASHLYDKKLKLSAENTRALSELIQYIKGQIEFFSKPLPKILSSYKTNNSFIADVISNKENANLSLIDKNVQNDVHILLSSLGKGFKTEQINLCNYTIDVLNNSYDKSSQEFVKKSKICRSLSLFISVCMVILLV